MTDLVAVADGVLARIRERDYAGYDPFDTLNSRIAQALPLYRSRFFRLALLQIGKRSPVNLRPLMAVPRGRNPKGVGLCILGMLEDHKRAPSETAMMECERLADWLLTQRCDPAVWHHSCWGYHFDWQSRAFFVPRGKPNIITTYYVSRALYLLGRERGRADLIDSALDSARFMRRHLLMGGEGRAFFAYIPGETTFVHNASLWGSAWVVDAGLALGDDEMVATGLRVAHYSVEDQQSDGAWRYGTAPHHGFIDGFHTGYNLEALHLIDEATGRGDFASAISKGLNYYRKNFFEPDGACRYYDTSLYPIDMHSIAQAVITLSVVGGTTQDHALVDRIIAWAIANIYDARANRFYYQRTRLGMNRIEYMRWTQAWAYLALALHNRIEAQDR